MNGKKPFVANFEEKPSEVVEISPSYNEKLQMGGNSDKGGTERETQKVTRNGEPDYDRDFEDD